MNEVLLKLLSQWFGKSIIDIKKPEIFKKVANTKLFEEFFPDDGTTGEKFSLNELALFPLSELADKVFKRIVVKRSLNQ